MHNIFLKSSQYSDIRVRIRVFCFLFTFAALSLCALPLAEVRAYRAEKAQSELFMSGIDGLTEAVSRIASGEILPETIGAADVSLSLIALDEETALSLADFLRCAAQLSPDSPNYRHVTDYAKALYARLRCIADTAASSEMSTKELTALTSALRLSLNLPEVSPFAAQIAEDESKRPENDDEREISEGEARDMANAIIGKKAVLRLDASDPEKWVFTCANAYAEISHSGRLLSFSLSVPPKPAILTLSEALAVLDDFMLTYAPHPFRLTDTYEEAGLLWAKYDTNDGKAVAAVTLDCGKVVFFTISQ